MIIKIWLKEQPLSRHLSTEFLFLISEQIYICFQSLVLDIFSETKEHATFDFCLSDYTSTDTHSSFTSSKFKAI